MKKILEISNPSKCPFNESEICIKCSKGNWVLKCSGNEIPEECPLTDAPVVTKEKQGAAKASKGGDAKKQRKPRDEPPKTQKEMAEIVNKILVKEKVIKDGERYYLPSKSKNHPSPFSVFTELKHLEFKKKGAKTHSATKKGLRAGTIVESYNSNHQKIVLLSPRCSKRYLVNYAKAHPLKVQ